MEERDSIMSISVTIDGISKSKKPALRKKNNA
jgi:hypothetical protein